MEKTSDREKTCCFFGHRKISKSEDLSSSLTKTVEWLITEKGVDTFLFGSNSAFDLLCHETVTKLKEKHPHIRRIYVRAEFPFIDEHYTNYLLKSYEETYFPEKIINAGKASYVERNREMINKSHFCVVYYDENYVPPLRKHSRRSVSTYQPKSGTQLAFSYAKKQNKQLFNLFL